MTVLLERYFSRLERRQPWRWRGHVLESVGQTIESAGPPVSVGECCEIEDRMGHPHRAEVIGFRGSNVLSMPVETTEGIRFGDAVWAEGTKPEIEVGPALMGRVLNAMGAPIDEGRPPAVATMLPLDGAVRPALDRAAISEPLGTGIRAIDAMLTVGRGQRVGIFGGSGVGKSTLIGMMTRNTEAEVTIVGLVGERGREVGEFLRDSLGKEGLARAVVVVSTSDQSPLLRMRAALTATTLAEFFAAQGKHVLLVLDSLTRFAMAAREIGLAAGEPPTAKGYTPSVFRAPGAAGRTRRLFSHRLDHGVLHRADGGRRPAGSACGCGAFTARRAHCAFARDGGRGLVSAHRGAGFDQPADARGGWGRASRAGRAGAQVAGDLCALRGSGADRRVQGGR